MYVLSDLNSLYCLSATTLQEAIDNDYTVSYLVLTLIIVIIHSVSLKHTGFSRILTLHIYT